MLFLFVALVSTASVSVTPDEWAAMVPPYLLAFVSPVCPHCVALAPMLDAVENIPVVTLNCQVHQAACEREGVYGWPQIRLVLDQDTVKTATNADRTSAAALNAFVRMATQGHVVEILRDETSLDQWQEQLSLGGIGIFGAVDAQESRQERMFALLEGAATLCAAEEACDARFAMVVVDAPPSWQEHVALVRKTSEEIEDFYVGPVDEPETLFAWARARRKPLLEKHSISAYSVDEPLLFLHRDLNVDDLGIVEAVREAGERLRGESLAWAWLDAAEWDGTRAGLSGTTYPAITIDDIRYLNTRYAFDESTEITPDTVEAWARAFLAGTLAKTQYSEPIPNNAGKVVKTMVLDTFDEMVMNPATAPAHVFVAFHSPTCGTCQSLYAPFQALAESHDGSVSFVLANGWMNDWPAWIGVTGVPDLRLFLPVWENGERKSIEMGGNDRSTEKMRSWLAKHVTPEGHTEL